MASEFYEFSGICKWPRLSEPDPKYNCWSICVYLDEASKKLFDKSGVQCEPQSDEDGVYVKFRRPAEKIIKKELVEFPKPAVIDKNSVVVDPMVVGNGSRVRVTVRVFDTMKGKGHRLERVVIEDLVGYHRPDYDG